MSATSSHSQYETKWDRWFTNRAKSWVIETSFSRFVKRAAKPSLNRMWRRFLLDDAYTKISGVFWPAPDADPQRIRDWFFENYTSCWTQTRAAVCKWTTKKLLQTRQTNGNNKKPSSVLKALAYTYNIPCCRQSSWPVSILLFHIQNLPCDREHKLVLSQHGE